MAGKKQNPFKKGGKTPAKKGSMPMEKEDMPMKGKKKGGCK